MIRKNASNVNTEKIKQFKMKKKLKIGLMGINRPG
jgi:hypothetical protein